MLSLYRVKGGIIVKFYQQTAFIVFMLIIFFPVGLFLMWKNQHFNKVTRISVSLFFVFAMFGYLANEMMANQNKNSEDVTSLGPISVRPIKSTLENEQVATYIYIDSKRSLVNEESLKKFVKEDLPRFESANRVFIDLNDGYGLNFIRSMPLVDYGKVEDERISEVYENHMIDIKNNKIQTLIYEGSSVYKPFL